MKVRKQYTKEFKEGAVRLVTGQGRTQSDAAKSLGISEWTLSRWVRAARTEGSAAFRAHGQRYTVRARELRVAPAGQATRRGARHIKKGGGVLCQEHRVKYAFIRKHQTEFSIRAMCRVFDLNPAGYYLWRSRKPSLMDEENQCLLEQIKVIHDESRKTYGSPKVCRKLRRAGVMVNHKPIARLMKEHSMRAKRVKKFKATTDSRHLSQMDDANQGLASGTQSLCDYL